MKKFTLLIVLFLTVGFFQLNGHSFNLKVGLFYPSMDSDLWDDNIYNLAFNKQDMVDGYYGLEYEHFFGKTFSLSVEGGYYSQTVFTMYKDFEYDDGSPIEQDITLKLFSFEVDFKLYPAGHKKKFCPFVGAGLGMYHWKYIQGGDFLYFDEQGEVYDLEENVEAYTSAWTPGFNARAGFVVKFRRSFGLSFEMRYIALKGNLSALFEGFEKFDLGSFSFSIGLNFSFEGYQRRYR